MQEARKRKVAVPDELSIIGIDDYAYLHMLETVPTVVDHRLPELGYAGGTMLIDLIEEKLAAPALQMLGPQLLPGETTASRH